MAIDRDLINKQIFNGTRTPATGWVSPVVDGFKADACGESCTFDAASRPRQLYDAAGGYTGTLTLTYNADGGHGPGPRRSATRSRTPWASSASPTPTVDFETYPGQIDASGAEGHLPVRLGDGLPVDRELPGPDLRQRAAGSN